MNRTQEKIPRSGPQREALREKGQFWTPDWIAEAMVRYVEPDVSRELFDPAFGAGAFFLAAKRLLRDLSQIDLQANEIDASSLQKATANGLSPHEIQNVKIRNFLLTPPNRKFKSIVANPPYIRHHRIPLQVKIRLKALSQAITGNKLDGRAGLHIFFLIQALGLLAEGGRLAFILPGDTFEGVFAQELWYWIARHFRIDAVITFASAAAPFPGVDTNAVVIFITNRSPKSELKWGRCTQPNTANLGQWINSGMNTDSLFPGEIYQRDLDEALETGLSRPPVRERQGISPP
jgi:tRNA1(Val) A37 N6-methylase TrmN6